MFESKLHLLTYLGIPFVSIKSSECHVSGYHPWVGRVPAFIPKGFFSPNRIKADFLGIYSPSSQEAYRPSWGERNGSVRELRASPDEFFSNRELFPLGCCISCHEAEVANLITLGFGLTKSQEEKRCWIPSVHSWPGSKERTREVRWFQSGVHPWGRVERHTRAGGKLEGLRYMLWQAWEERKSLHGLLPRNGLGAAPWFKIMFSHL